MKTARRERASRARAEAPRAPRDQAESSFVPILRTLVSRVPGAVAAALVDLEGETVDYATDRLEPFDVKLTAAHWRLVLTEIASAPALGHLRELIVRGARRSFIARPLPDGYALVLTLIRRAGFTASSRAILACERALSREAGWRRVPPAQAPPAAPAAPAAPDWFPVRVTADARRRPLEVSGAFEDGTKKRAQPVEVLGALVGLGPRERGFRVRLATGIELNVVRESGGFWYADEEL